MTAPSQIKKSERQSNFPTDSQKFPMEETMGAKNFNFPPKFSKNGGLHAFLDKNFSTGRKFSNFVTVKNLGKGIAPALPPPLRRH